MILPLTLLASYKAALSLFSQDRGRLRSLTLCKVIACGVLGRKAHPKPHLARFTLPFSGTPMA